MFKKSILSLGLILATVFFATCVFERPAPIDRQTVIDDAPLLTPEQFIAHTHLEDGFELQLVAAEPQVIAPIAMVFDERHRIWALEMTGYMTDIDGTEEESPMGKIVILEDKNNDGRYENRTVFLDSLTLPRALALVEGGILVVEPPKLWYYKIKDDRPSNKTLVDSAYTTGGNLEYMANGLFRGIDNWLYNAASNKRYRKKGNEWLVEPTHLRGQWGLAQDDLGRLFYNNNSQNILGDYYLPGLGGGNPNIARMPGFNERIIADNRTFPSRPTSGVNRGYMGNVLDDSLRLTSFTAACGPLIYRDTLFGDAYYQNAFVAEPAANLIKRNILHFDNETVTGELAYEGKEFLASDDERFRPVSLYNGPDGALYVVDMYRGIIQHKLFLTQYLKDEIHERELENYVNCGRIYKIVPSGHRRNKKAGPLPTDASELVELLASPISWEREKAQQLLVEGNRNEAIPLLQNRLRQSASLVERIHCLWTLEGLDALEINTLLPLLDASNEPFLVAHALAAMGDVVSTDNAQLFYDAVAPLAGDSFFAPYVAFQLHVFDRAHPALSHALMQTLVATHPDSDGIALAILSNKHGQEKDFMSVVATMDGMHPPRLVEQTSNLVRHIHNTRENAQDIEFRKKYARGIGVFRSTCQSCHGEDGKGLEFLAPPLSNSEWVTGDKEVLIAIVLYGMAGPVTVNGKVYTVPEVASEMPGIIHNKDLVESDVALMLSYIRNSWGNEASDITLDDIKRVKEKYEGREQPFTESEFNALDTTGD